MADPDEDAIPSTTHDEDIDLSDETQDFRLLATLSSLSSTTTTTTTKIPKRGEKDFEPHSTHLQSSTLALSRHAMHAALSHPRFHQPSKSYNRAIYHPETNLAYAQNPRGPLFAKMGRVLGKGEDPLGEGERGVRVWLLPEEALYLVERGTLDLRWPVGDGDGENEGLPMSLQGAYAMFIGDGAGREKGGNGRGLTFERYSVYAGLKRMGYTVLRAPSWDGVGERLGAETFPPVGKRSMWETGLGGFWTRLFASRPLDLTEEQEGGPLVPSRLYRSYVDVYRRLALIPFHDPASQQQTDSETMPSTDHNYRITYHVWKPGSTTFKKTAPGTPDFRIAVVNARETSVPTLEQLSALMETVPYDPPKPEAQMYQKLRHGHKNFILAVVDQGVTSYLRVADAAFGKEKLYERKGRGPNAKRGGARGGRGRGRGR